MRFNAEKKLFEVDILDMEAISLPEGIQDLMKLRIKELDDSDIEILQTAACIGPRVTKYNPLSQSSLISVFNSVLP